MRLLTILLFVFSFSCSKPDKENGIFYELSTAENVVIYLGSFNLENVPEDISELKKAKSLFIRKDTMSFWFAYPTPGAIDRIIKEPPFRKLPDEITELTQLRVLKLIDLDLSELPENFDRLQNLDSLDLSMNKLTVSKELEKLKKLTNLKYLGLFRNKVDTTDIYELKRINPNLLIDNGNSKF